MSPKYAIALVLALGVSVGSVGARNDQQGALEKLEKKIQKNLRKGKWNDNSVAFLKALWSDYKNAHLNGESNPGVRYSIFGRVPDIKRYETYVGKYRRDGRPYVEIVEIDGRFFVLADNHKTPAVPENGSIVFTTGDVVYSTLPKLAGQPYADLEMYRIARFDGKYQASGLREDPSDWVSLDRAKE